jgi:hypothetical protein
MYFVLVADEESVLAGGVDTAESRREYDVRELISFASFDIPIDTNLQGQTTDVNNLISTKNRPTYNLYFSHYSMMIHSIHLIFTGNQHQIILGQVNIIFQLNDNHLLSLDHYPPATGSTFHVDPLGMTASPVRETNSPLNIFPSTFTNTNNNLFAQSQHQLIPTRITTPTQPIAATQSPLTMKKLSLNPTIKKNDPMTDLLDFSDPTPPPESPKFDPYA